MQKRVHKDWRKACCVWIQLHGGIAVSNGSLSLELNNPTAIFFMHYCRFVNIRLFQSKNKPVHKRVGHSKNHLIITGHGENSISRSRNNNSGLPRFQRANEVFGALHLSPEQTLNFFLHIESGGLQDARYLCRVAIKHHSVGSNGDFVEGADEKGLILF